MTIDRYIASFFVRSYLMLLLAGVGLYIFADVLANLDEFTEDPALSTTQVLTNIADYYGNNLPLYYHQLGGVLLCAAASFTFAIMLQNNEMTALVAAGVPLQRLALPVIVTSVLLVALWLANAELLLPSFAHKVARRPDDLTHTRRVEVHCVRDDQNAIVTAQELRTELGWMKGVYIIAPDADGRPSYLIRADAARWDPDQQLWQLERGARLTVGDVFGDAAMGAAIRWAPVDSYPLRLTPAQILLRQSSVWADLMSIRQMNRLLRSGNLPNKPAIAQARDIRFTQPLLAWILILLAVPFFLTREPSNVLAAGGKALLLTGACFALAFVAHSVPTDALTARVATAVPVLVFGPVAVLHFANVKT
jgi:lipopolysaccharide export system permease protein